MHVHIGESNEGNDGGGDGGVPDYGQCVPEDVGWVLPGLTWLYKAGPVSILDNFYVNTSTCTPLRISCVLPFISTSRNLGILRAKEVTVTGIT